MQAAPLYQDIISKIQLLQVAVNNLVAANAQSATYLGAQLVTAGHITALQAAMTTLQGDVTTFQNTIPAVVAGN
jgi:hypothetical protein